jgi:hypothetical protein
MSEPGSARSFGGAFPAHPQFGRWASYGRKPPQTFKEENDMTKPSIVFRPWNLR